MAHDPRAAGSRLCTTDALSADDIAALRTLAEEARQLYARSSELRAQQLAAREEQAKLAAEMEALVAQFDVAASLVPLRIRDGGTAGAVPGCRRDVVWRAMQPLLRSMEEGPQEKWRAHAIIAAPPLPLDSPKWRAPDALPCVAGLRLCPLSGSDTKIESAGVVFAECEMAAAWGHLAWAMHTLTEDAGLETRFELAPRGAQSVARDRRTGNTYPLFIAHRALDGPTAAATDAARLASLTTEAAMSAFEQAAWCMVLCVQEVGMALLSSSGAELPHRAAKQHLGRFALLLQPQEPWGGAAWRGACTCLLQNVSRLFA